MTETKPTVLIVDDPILHRAYSLALSKSGFEVKLAFSFEEVDKLLRNGSGIDAVVAAYGSAPKSGLDIIEAARQTKPEIPCLLVSAVCSPSSPEFVNAVKRCGNIDYVQKCEGWFDYLGPTLQKYFK